MTDMPDASPIALVDRVAAALEASAGDYTDAAYQCGRLRHALEHAHSEGARFAAFTLGRLIANAQPPVDPAVQEAYGQLRSILIASGLKL